MCASAARLDLLRKSIVAAAAAVVIVAAVAAELATHAYQKFVLLALILVLTVLKYFCR